MKRRILLVVLAGLAIVGGVFAWRETRDTPTAYDHASVTINNQTIRVRVPTTLATETKGLGGVAALADDEGMMWRYEPPREVGFWMKGMIMALDFIWIRDGQVVGVTADVPPPASTASDLPLYAPPSPADRVLEVRAGWAAQFGVTIDSIVVER